MDKEKCVLCEEMEDYNLGTRCEACSDFYCEVCAEEQIQVCGKSVDDMELICTECINR